jgi:endonuclease/exonuclease/phosphatase family metal-dependent hydrolase
MADAKRNNHTDRVLSHRLRSLGSAERLQVAASVLSEPGEFDPELCNLLISEIRQTDAATLESWLAELPNIPAAAWVRAQVASGDENASAAWEKFFLRTRAATRRICSPTRDRWPAAGASKKRRPRSAPRLRSQCDILCSRALESSSKRLRPRG